MCKILTIDATSFQSPGISIGNVVYFSLKISLSVQNVNPTPTRDYWQQIPLYTELLMHKYSQKGKALQNTRPP